MALPTRTHSKKSKRGVELVHDTPYEAAYSAFRLALQEHVGEGVPCWVDAEDIDIDTYGGDDKTGYGSGTARYKTTSADGQRIAPRKDCKWEVRWRLVDDSGLPRTELIDYTIT